MESTTFDRLCTFARETALVRSVEELLQWDERTCLPVAAGTFRADQVTYLSGLVHQRRTDPRLGEWLQELLASSLAADPHSDAGVTIRHLWREYQKLVRVPSRLVEELARAAVLGQQTWAEARRQDDFHAFRPRFAEMVRLKRERKRFRSARRRLSAVSWLRRSGSTSVAGGWT
jgi:carboxypeptidase Taq